MLHENFSLLWHSHAHVSKTDWIDLNVQFDDAKSREAGKAAVGCIDMNVLWTEGVDRDPVSASQQRPLDGWMRTTAATMIEKVA